MRQQFLLLCLISIMFSCTNTDKEKKADTTAVVTPNDTNIIKKSAEKMIEQDRATFLTHAAIGGLMEVETSAKLLAGPKTNPTVTAYAQMMVNDHTKANEELKLIAKQENFTLPTVLPKEKLELLKQFESLNQEAKNEFYINLMLNEHNKAIDVFSLAERGGDETIAAFASKTLPTLRHHYKKTVEIKNALLAAKSNQGDDVLKISNKTSANPAKNQ